MGAKDQHCVKNLVRIQPIQPCLILFVCLFFALKTLDNASGLFEFKSKSNQIRFSSSITRGVVAPSPEPEDHVLSVRAFELSSFPLAQNFENDPSEKMTPKINTYNNYYLGWLGILDTTADYSDSDKKR